MQCSVLIAGCGDLGNNLGERLIDDHCEVFGLRRNIDQLSNSIHPIVYDLSSDAPVPALPEVDYLVYTAAAKSREIETYRKVYVDGPLKILSALPKPPKRVILIGSTGVFHQNKHEWIDESSEACPDNPFGQLLLAGEQKLAQAGTPTTVARCSGIYGPGRNHLLNRIRNGVIAPSEPLHFSNRIHRDDAARFLAHLIKLDAAGERLDDLYLLSDSQPTPIHEVTRWLAQQLGVSVEREEVIARGGSKQISNARMLATGFELSYPSFKEGFSAILNP